MDLFTLPVELLIAIIAYLDPNDILAFCRICRLAHDVYEGSALLRYLVTLFATGMEDVNVLRPLDNGDRLAYLLQREALWGNIDFSRERHVMIPVNHRHSHVHDLTAGVYIFGDLSLVPDSLRTSSLRYVYLPTCTHRQELSRIDANPDWWTSAPIGVEALTIGLSLEENDLLAVLTSVPSPESVIQFHEHRDEGNHCIATIEIAGPYLLVLLAWLRSNASDELYVYDWTKAFLISHVSSENATYRGAAFLSSDTFILTNMRDNTIEFLSLVVPHAENERTRCRWVGKLALPALRRGSSLVSISCRTDAVRDCVVGVSAAARDSGSSLRSRSHRRAPVRCAPEKALVQFRMYLQGSREGHISLFTFVAHRGELLRIVNSSGFSTSTTEPTPLIAKPWDTWGPQATRWSDANETDTAWMAGNAGQRQVFITRDRPRHIRVRNYNAAAVRKVSMSTQRKVERRVKAVTGESITAHQDCFLNDIRSALPFFEISSEQTFDYDGVLMDEEHIIGLMEDEEDGYIRQLDVFIITPEKPQTCDCAHVK
ncbi:hypothetical protein EW145_g6075 [Phellinidium pouzarii]|uniref:F-box domain-containing protein n=1 Tax=Phellinidium pouzarii TaxID=167371 RepID=A0A4S4KXT2_9AGAM|nr:hypothetical protein EW145_g6075 [Phellinidium pouzarii]